MGLKELELDGFYDSDERNLLTEFYIPALKESIVYKRIAGYFCSNSLAIAAKGISKFIENDGMMYLIVNVVLSKDDQKTIKEAIEAKEKEILEEISNMEDLLKRGHLQLLAWMIKNDKLDIKIANVRIGVEHKKKGIFEDSVGNIISFTGSDNETVSGWLYNHEDFHVFCDWIEGDNVRHLQPDIRSFERLWNNEANDVQIYDASEAFRLGLIENAPNTTEEFQTLSNEMAKELLRIHQSKIEKSKILKGSPTRDNLNQFLREYQKEALKNWEEKNELGILDMATGTGKTFVAIAALNNYLKRRKKGLIVIVVPKTLLVTQWSDELRKIGFSNIIEVMKSSSIWKEKLTASLLKIELGREQELIAIATYNSFCSQNFIDIINNTNLNLLLICDEMHHSWAPKFREGLLIKYASRLGLSATPERYLDIEGTKNMQNYFGGIVFRFPISEAIPEFLVRYEYHAEIVELTDDEKEKYEKLTMDISKKISTIVDEEIPDSLLRLLIRRSKIVTNSESKWAAFDKILDRNPNMRRTLIYCSERQINEVLRKLRSRKIYANKITYKEPLKYRKEIIDLFTRDEYEAIVAIKVLDEGIDVPGIEQAIILASSGNPIEFIQRRGRILRKSKNKDYAAIHDILVFPWLDTPIDIMKGEISIIKRELRRVEEFINSAMNPLEVMNKIAKYKSIVQ